MWDGGASWPHELSIKSPVPTPSDTINLLCGPKLGMCGRVGPLAT